MDHVTSSAGISVVRQAPGRSRPLLLRAALVVVAAAMLLLAVPGTSDAAVTVSRAEVSGDRIRVEGTATPNSTITVDGLAMGSSDAAGEFKVERTGFTAPADCTVDVSDGAATATATLSGCTVSSAPSPPPSQVAVSALTLSQTSVIGGRSVTGTVSVTTAAPSGGFVVALSSSNAAIARVPASVTVPAGSTSTGFTVSTTAVSDTQSATINAAGGRASRSATLTVVPESVESRGSISLARGGVGHGRVTSQPAGVDCTFTSDTTSGACNNVFFPIGTEVKLEARPSANSSFRGWEFEVSCRDAPEVTIEAGVAHICRPAFALK